MKRYYKIENGREVISDCTSLRINGLWVSMPSEELILSEGWIPYTPPESIPQLQNEPDYYDVMEAIKKMFASNTEAMSDDEALEVAALYPTWSSKLNKVNPSMPGEQVTAGERLWDDGKLWKVLQSHNVQEDWRPKDSPSLFVEVSIVEWPDWVQPKGSTDAYNKGDGVTHNGRHWESEYDANTWEPGVFGWKEV